MKKKLLALAAMGLMLVSAGRSYAAEPAKEIGSVQMEQSMEQMKESLEGSIVSCLIPGTNREQVRVEVSFPEGTVLPEKLYLFAQPVYEGELAGAVPAAELTTTDGQTTFVFETELMDGEESRLYSRFRAAVAGEDGYDPVTDYAWISNPEILAEDEVPSHKLSYVNPRKNSKKGVQVVNNMLSDIEDLGASHSFFNIIFQEIISLTPTNYSYSYGGRTYYFVERIVQDYDELISTLYDLGADVTIALLSVHRGGYEFLLPPGITPRAGTHGYAWNTYTEEGTNYILATLSFLASRYNGTNDQCGIVKNWVIGNEVNDNLQYYYIGEKDRDNFVKEYYKTFRLAYNALISGNRSANVYIPLQGRWMTQDTSGDYGGRGFLELFNNLARAEGNFNWGLAYHPYSHPLSTDNILKDGTSMPDQTGMILDAGHVTDAWNTPIITMKNINVLTDFMNAATMKTSSGAVRSIILSEQGWTSVSNTGATESTQAANIVLAYYKAEMNPDIDAFILRGHVDAEEGSPYYKFGLWHCSSSNIASAPKIAHDVFKYMDTNVSIQATNFAKGILGIKNWSDVIPNFNANHFNNMRSIEMADMVHLADWGRATNSLKIAEGMFNQWSNQYNTHGLSEHGYPDPVTGYVTHYPKGTAVANPYAHHLAYQGIKYEFSDPIDATYRPYLGFKAKFIPKDLSGANDKLLVRIRVFSGVHINDSNAVIDVNKEYNLCANLSKWSHRNAIDRVEVWVKEYGQDKSFDGTFTIYDLQYAQGISTSSELQHEYSLNPANALFVFSDVHVRPGNWKYESVKYVYEKGLMQGISSTTLFQPDHPLTRAMFATVLYRMAGSPQVTYSNRFPDVPDGQWYSKAIMWVVQKGIAKGLDTGAFGTNDFIKRDQVAKMLYEYGIKQGGYSLTERKSLGTFTDYSIVDSWSYQYLEWAVGAEIITGKPNGNASTYRLDPKAGATRAECAAMLKRFLDKYQK